MKSFFAMICSALAMTQAAQAQTTWLSADFSNGIPQGFVLHDNDGRTPSTDMANIGFEVGKAWITTPEGKDGNMVACSTSWYKNAGQADDWMVTTAIEVKSDKAVLRWRARTSDKDYRDGYAVLVSEKGQQSADFDTQASLYQTSKENYNWTSHEVSLAQYAGKTIYIAFVNNSKDKACLYIDDVFAGIPSTVDFTINLSRVINRYGDVTVSGTAFATGATPANGFTIGLRAGDQLIEQHFDNTLNALLKETGGEELLTNVLNYDKDAWNTDGAKQTIDILAKLVSPDYLYSDTVSNANAKDGFTMNQQAVIDGKALFMPNGDWVVNEMADTTPEDYHWGLLPLPALEKDGERFVGSMTEQVWIPAQAKNVDDAKAFLKFIYSDEGIKIMAEGGNIVPSANMSDTIAAMEDGYTKEFFSVYDTASAALGAFAPYNTDNLPDFDRAATVFGSIDSLATGELTAKDYQSKLADAWVKLSKNKAVTE